MTRDEKDELSVKFACAALTGLTQNGQYHANQVALAAWSFADAMLVEYMKRQPAAPVASISAPPTDAERAEVARIIEQYKAQMADDDSPEPRVCPEVARNVGTPPA